MMITVKTAKDSDVEFIAALEKETFSTPQSPSSLQKMIDDGSNILLVALCDGEYAGYIGAYTVLRESDIVTVAVLPSFRRKGIARELLSELFKRLSGESDSLFLEVRESNVAARSLYSSLGFEEIGVRKGYYRSPSENAVLYKKDL